MNRSDRTPYHILHTGLWIRLISMLCMVAVTGLALAAWILRQRDVLDALCLVFTLYCMVVLIDSLFLFFTLSELGQLSPWYGRASGLLLFDFILHAVVDVSMIFLYAVESRVLINAQIRSFIYMVNSLVTAAAMVSPWFLGMLLNCSVLRGLEETNRIYGGEIMPFRGLAIQVRLTSILLISCGTVYLLLRAFHRVRGVFGAVAMVACALLFLLRVFLQLRILRTVKKTKRLVDEIST